MLAQKKPRQFGDGLARKATMTARFSFWPVASGLIRANIRGNPTAGQQLEVPLLSNKPECGK